MRNSARQEIDSAQKALETRRLDSWPPWQERLLRAANSLATNGDKKGLREALELWRAISEQRGGYAWGSRDKRESLLRVADGEIPQEFVELLRNPPRTPGVFTSAVSGARS